jgi:hypothetical protein
MRPSLRIHRFCGVAIALVLAVLSFATAPTRAQEDNDDADIAFPSPNKRYALSLKNETRGNEVVDRVEIIELATKRPVARLDDPEDGTAIAERTRLDWSPDSKRVAAYTGGFRGGSTRIFVEKDQGLTEVRLPELPDLPEGPSKEVAKKHKEGFPIPGTVSALTFARWTDAGVVLNLGNFWKSRQGFSLCWDIEIVLAIDAKNRAKIVKTTKKETVHGDQ